VTKDVKRKKPVGPYSRGRTGAVINVLARGAKTLKTKGHIPTRLWEWTMKTTYKVGQGTSREKPL